MFNSFLSLCLSAFLSLKDLQIAFLTGQKRVQYENRCVRFRYCTHDKNSQLEFSLLFVTDVSRRTQFKFFHSLTFEILASQKTLGGFLLF